MDVIDRLIQREGGFADDPADRGGATRYGITRATLASWRGAPVTVEDVRALPLAEAREIYQTRFLHGPGIDQLPAPLQDLVFDMAVTSGPGVAIRALQEVLGVGADGVLGPRTVAAALVAPEGTTITKLAKWRVLMLARIARRDPSQLAFLTGWLARTLTFIPDGADAPGGMT